MKIYKFTNIVELSFNGALLLDVFMSVGLHLGRMENPASSVEVIQTQKGLNFFIC